MGTWGFTRREKEVIELMSEGKTTDEISKILNIGRSAVRTHKQNLYDKMEISGEDRALKAVLKFQKEDL